MVSIVRALLSGVSPKAAAIAAASAIVSVTALPLAAPAQTTTTDVPVEETAPAEGSTPNAPRAIEQSNSPIGIAAGQALMAEAEGAIASQNYTLAATKLEEARKALNDVSTYYKNLSGVFVGVDTRVTSNLRDL